MVSMCLFTRELYMDSVFRKRRRLKTPLHRYSARHVGICPVKSMEKPSPISSSSVLESTHKKSSLSCCLFLCPLLLAANLGVFSGAWLCVERGFMDVLCGM